MKLITRGQPSCKVLDSQQLVTILSVTNVTNHSCAGREERPLIIEVTMKMLSWVKSSRTAKYFGMWQTQLRSQRASLRKHHRNVQQLVTEMILAQLNLGISLDNKADKAPNCKKEHCWASSTWTSKENPCVYYAKAAKVTRTQLPLQWMSKR